MASSSLFELIFGYDNYPEIFILEIPVFGNDYLPFYFYNSRRVENGSSPLKS